MNVLGNLGCVAARNITNPTCSLIVSKLSTWILEVVVQDASLRVTLEGLDKFILYCSLLSSQLVITI